jgi:hypothetical protein
MRIGMMNDNFYRSSGAAIAIKRISQELKDVDYHVEGSVDGSISEDLSRAPAGNALTSNVKSYSGLQGMNLIQEMVQTA